MTTPEDDPRSLAALRARYGPRHRWWALLTVMIGNMAALMAATTINVAVPAISREFALGQQQAQWLATSFMAAMTVAMLATPWLLERYGYRRAYLAMLLLLGAGGAAGGMATGIGWVMAMRAVEGIAAGVLQTIPGIVIMRAFGERERGRAMGLFGFGTVLAPALGPSIGGLLVEWFGWRAIFFFVLPFCLLAFALGRRLLPHAAPGGVPVNPDAPRPDPLSLALLTLFIVALLNGGVQLQGAQPAFGFALLAAALGLGLAFVRRQRHAAGPLLQLALFGQPVFAMASVVGFIYGMGLFGSTYLLPLFMMQALHLPPSTVGAVLMPAGFALALAIPLAGRLADRGSAALLVVGGLLAMALSFAAMLGVTAASGLAWIVAWAVLGRIGLGFVIPSLSLTTLRNLPPTLISSGNGTMNFVRQLGGVVGVNLVGILLAWRSPAGAEPSAAATLRAFHEVFAVMAAITALAAVAAWRMRAAQAAAPG